MKYVVYIDVFFATNFFMDFLVLLLLRKILKPQTTIFRCFLGAMAGAGLTCIFTVFKPKSVIVQKIISYGIISSAMVLISYPVKNIKAFAKTFAALYFMTFMAAGIFGGLYFFTSLRYVVRRGIHIIRFGFITLITYFGADYIWGCISKFMSKSVKGNDIYDVSLKFNGREVHLKGLYDSGNSLLEPIDKTPVHIAEYEGIKPLIEGVSAEHVKIRIVPYRTIGTGTGWLKAIELDEASINVAGEEIKMGRVLVGLYEGTLSKGGGYNIILNRSIKKWL